MPSPLVSVVIIFLDAKPFLEEAIESVFAQRFQDWELLLVDDGSTDGSSEIARRHARRSPGRVRWMEHPGHANRGMSASRNAGIAAARGRYLTFLDADDAWADNPLGEQAEFLDRHPAVGMSYGATLWWYSWNGGGEHAGRDFLHETGLAPETELPPSGILKLILRNEGWSPCGCLWRRSLLLEVGGYDESFRGMYEDQVIHAKTSLRAPAYLHPGWWYKYRKDCGGCCARSVAAGDYRRARLRFLTWLQSHLRRNDVRDPELSHLVRECVFPVRHPLLFRARNRLGRLLSPAVALQARYA